MRVACRQIGRTQDVGDILRQAGIQPAGGDAKAGRLALANGIDRQHPAARDGLLRNHHHVQQELDAILGQ